MHITVFWGRRCLEIPSPYPADGWIDSYNLKSDAVVYEESRSLPLYESVLTLLWFKDDVQKRSDYQEEDDPSLDPNEFTLQRRKWPR